MTWSAEQVEETVVSLKIGAQRIKSWEQWVLLTSDVHLDNPLCNRQLYKKHLEQAKERNAPVFDFGFLPFLFLLPVFLLAVLCYAMLCYALIC